jgi:hypothetical protein
MTKKKKKKKDVFLRPRDKSLKRKGYKAWHKWNSKFQLVLLVHVERWL